MADLPPPLMPVVEETKKPIALVEDIWILVFDLIVEDGPWKLESEDNPPKPYVHWSILLQRREKNFMKWLRVTRLVSRMINTALLPHFYRHWNFSTPDRVKLLVAVEGSQNQHLLSNVQAHSRGLELMSNFDPVLTQQTTDLIKHCKKIEFASWNVINHTDRSPGFLAAIYLSAFMEAVPNCALSIDEGGMVLLKTSDDQGGGGSDAAVKRLRISGPSQIQPPPQLSGSKIPIMNELDMFQYCWPYNSPDEVSRQWDFSCLRRLRLSFMNIFGFLETVEAMDLSQLQCLEIVHCDLFDYRDRFHEQDSEDLDDLFEELFIATPRLEKFAFNHEDWEDCGLSNLRRVAGTLRSLELQGFPTIEPSHLKKIKRILPDLEELGIATLTDPDFYNGSIEEISGFLELRKLTLFPVGTRFGKAWYEQHQHDFPNYNQRFDYDSDPDYASAGLIMKKLHAKKKGCAFEVISIRFSVFGDQPGVRNMRERRIFSEVNESGQYEQWQTFED